MTAGGFKKLINDPFDAVDEALEGFVAAHADVVALAEPRVVVRRTRATDKAGLVVGGLWGGWGLGPGAGLRRLRGHRHRRRGCMRQHLRVATTQRHPRGDSCGRS